MANFSYKTTTTTILKVCGILDVSRMVIDLDGEEKSLNTLLSVFNGANIELVAKIKAESELDEPTDNE